MIIHQAAVPSDWVLIMSHGFRGSKDGGGRAVVMADWLAARGLNVVRYDFTPLTNLRTQIAELSAVVTRTKQDVGKKVILLGRSMGGCASLMYAAEHHDVRGLCLWSTPADLTATFSAVLGDCYQELLAGRPGIISDEFGTAEIEPDFITDFEDYDFCMSIKKIGVPLFTLHGSRDTVVPLVQAQKLFAAACEPKRLQIIAGADHQFSAHSQEAVNAVISWLNSLVPLENQCVYK